MSEYFKTRAKAPSLTLKMNQSLITMPTVRCTMKGKPVDVSLVVQMSGLLFDRLSVNVDTPKDIFAPINININQVHVNGDFETHLEIGLEETLLTVSGNLIAKDTNAEFGASRINEIVSGFNFAGKNENTPELLDVEVSLDITAKSRVQVSYNSFLRGVVVPDTSIYVGYSSSNDALVLRGDIPLRSGEILYLNNNFYIKEGEIKFDDKAKIFDPIISLRAETREADKNNHEVKIILSVNKQHLSNLKPVLTAQPAKSETEIMELLGNIVTGDSKNVSSLMFATGDYALQVMLIRRLENALRDLLNFDIFSLRTMIVQNALKQSFIREDQASKYTVGNYLDNSAVYIGKYFGNSLYADALFRLQYDKNRIQDSMSWQGLVLRPELGLEMDSPFVKIRWSVAPKIDEILENKWVPSSALTLSWEFNF